MGKCLYCGKNTINKFCCVDHSHKWDEINYPDKKCLNCGKQLYHDGYSLTAFEKVKFCDKHCFGNYRKSNTTKFNKSIINPWEHLIKSVHAGGMTVHIIQRGNFFYWKALSSNGKQISSNMFKCVEQVYADISIAF